MTSNLGSMECRRPSVLPVVCRTHGWVKLHRAAAYRVRCCTGFASSRYLNTPGNGSRCRSTSERVLPLRATRFCASPPLHSGAWARPLSCLLAWKAPARVSCSPGAVVLMIGRNDFLAATRPYQAKLSNLRSVRPLGPWPQLIERRGSFGALISSCPPH